jgi:hypothetical protein
MKEIKYIQYNYIVMQMYAGIQPLIYQYLPALFVRAVL